MAIAHAHLAPWVPGSNLAVRVNRAIDDRLAHTAGGHLLSVVQAATDTGGSMRCYQWLSLLQIIDHVKMLYVNLRNLFHCCYFFLFLCWFLLYFLLSSFYHIMMNDQWFKQRLILSVSKPSISQRSQIRGHRRTMCLPENLISKHNKLLFLTYKVLTTAEPSYLHNLISLQPSRSTCSSSVVTLSPANHLLENHGSLI